MSGSVNYGSPPVGRGLKCYCEQRFICANPFAPPHGARVEALFCVRDFGLSLVRPLTGRRELKRSGNYRREGSGKFAPTRGRELKHPPTGGRFPPHLVAHLTGGQGVVSSSLIEDVSETLADGSPPLGGVSWRGSGTISWGETK